MSTTAKWLKKWALLIILSIALFIFFYFKLYHYLTLASLGVYHLVLQQWALQHPVGSVLTYIAAFTGLIACGIPGATILGLLGGFIFGQIAVIYATAATTFGGCILFLAVKYSFAKSFAKKSRGWLKKFEAGFHRNAFRYLLTLRLIPILPCWVSNISAGIFNVPFWTFFLATVIGVLPSTYLYVLAGRSLDILLADQHFTTTQILLQPHVLLPIVGLIIIALLPIIYRLIRGNNDFER